MIWATQVLDRLVKKGTPSRAEVSDAVLAARAECVMLNKGAFLEEAIRMLREVLSRIREHQYKKTPQDAAPGDVVVAGPKASSGFGGEGLLRPSFICLHVPRTGCPQGGVVQ